MVEENKFRADLYYRLHVFPLHVPSLRERREDIPLLTRYFVQKHAQRMGRNIDNIPTAALDALTRYDWPGNIRELQNVIERSVIFDQRKHTERHDAGVRGEDGPAPLASRALGQDVERQRILRAIDEAKGQIGGRNGAAPVSA
jgi:formate hydrogenlyase transcriptional activator